jgi:PAS domain S-box-containing protein
MNGGLSKLVWSASASEASSAILGVVFADPITGEIVHTNELADDLFGYGPGELAGRQLEELLPEDSRARHAEYRKAFAADPHPRPMGHGIVLFGRRKDGTTFPVQVALSPVRVLERDVVAAFVLDLSGAVATLSRTADVLSDSGVLRKSAQEGET